MAWNRAHATLTDKQASALSQMFGHMTETYLPGRRSLVVMEPYTLVVGTNTHSMSGFTNSSTYSVLKTTDDTAIVKKLSGFMADDVATVHFDGPHMYWLLLNEDNPATSAREYSKRIGGPSAFGDAANHRK